MLPFLVNAAEIAAKTDYNEKRNFLLAAIGIRRDGAIVSAKNGAVISSTYDDYRIISDAHAECRALRKMDRGGILYVARILKKDGSMAISRPCPICQLRIKAAQINKVYYTINAHQYGVWNVKEDRDTVYDA